jgi:hypothetical protein
MRAFAGVVAAALALAACGGPSDDGPRVLPTLDPSPSPSVSVSASPSAVPTGAAAAKDAAAFATFVYEEIERAFVARDPSIVEALSAPECTSCRNFIESITGLRDTNGRVEGYTITVRSAVAPADTGQTARVDIVRDSTASVEYDSAGKVVSREPGLRGIEEQMNLERKGGSWVVTKIIRIRVRG